MRELLHTVHYCDQKVVFPSMNLAWGPESAAPGLLATGGDLSPTTLHNAYKQGIFPWFSIEQPILWWSPDPRMVLHPPQFKVHHSFGRVLRQFQANPQCEIRIDSAFAQVINACAHTNRKGASGTWIVPKMEAAYNKLHNAGYAHSIETWINNRLVGGLYCVVIGRAVFGESMFSQASNTSKIALAALVALCRHYGITMIDCQQQTEHLTSLGAIAIPRQTFIQEVAHNSTQNDVKWQFSPLYWNYLLRPKGNL
jgi:leucyl/phenylalanyl-tRNA---protein transferase